ncbi:MAG: hypothetical protein ACN6O3_06230 [Comamonas sp.]
MNAFGNFWSDTQARNTVWSALGNGGGAPNSNHLVIGDQVMIYNNSGYSESRMWTGSAWTFPGVVINGDMVVDGSLAAQKIDTRGLTIRDANGNVILGAGVKMDISWLANLGDLGKKNSVSIGTTTSDVKLPDGSSMRSSDFVNRLAKIGTGNISTFMESAAIGNAYIGNLAVSTLKIQDFAVTVPVGADGNGYVPSAVVWMEFPGKIAVFALCNWLAPGGGGATCHLRAQCDGSLGPEVGVSMGDGDSGSATAFAVFDVGAGGHTVTFAQRQSSGSARNVGATGLFAIGVKK